MLTLSANSETLVVNDFNELSIKNDIHYKVSGIILKFCPKISLEQVCVRKRDF